MFLRKIAVIFLFCAFSTVVLGYGIYRATPIILGPKIEVTTPNDGEIVEGTSIDISGIVYRSKSLTINNIPTAFTESGNFDSRLAVYPGSNIVILKAYDRFGRSVSKILNVGTK